MFKFAVCTLLTVLFVSVISTSKNDPEVQINQGVLKGKYLQTRKGRTISAFTGIPYAKPPVGNLRFEAPIAAKPWQGIFEATKSHSICPQSNLLAGDFSISGDEDCLYLNVYTPQLPKSTKELLPVMFYIHGGAFLLGEAGEQLYGPQILLDKDVILVAANYRLGPLGFLTTGDEVVPGNNGLKDQNLAIKWVKENIARFGGDGESITLFGQSAGGASTHYHMLSPLSKDLIKGAISLSGTALSVWALAPNDEGIRNSKKLANILNCPTESSHKMVKCLKTFDAKIITGQEAKFTDWWLDPMVPFKPVIEPNVVGAFLPQHPVDIIKSGNVARIPFVTGLTSEDGCLKSPAMFGNPELLDELNRNFNKVAPITLMYQETAANSNKDYISEKVREFYFGDKEIDNSTRKQVTDMFTDSMFFVAEDNTVRLHFRHLEQPVYYYLFEYHGSISFSSIFGDSIHDYGVCHGDDMFHVFPIGKLFPNYTPSNSDDKMTEIMTTLWTNFAKTGNPTPETNSVISTIWEPVQSENLEYYRIKSETDIQNAKNLYLERADFWKSLPLGLKSIKDEL